MAADNSMSEAATKVKEICEKQKESTSFPGDDRLTDCTVFLDGSWQNRGHDSLNGVVTAINRVNDKVIDYHVMRKKCKSVPNPEQKEWVSRMMYGRQSISAL